MAIDALIGSDTFSVYAINYARSDESRSARENFRNIVDIHDVSMPMDFFVWLIVGKGRVILVDGGTSEAVCRARNHHFLRSPLDCLGDLRIAPPMVTDLIVTHMHWDHLGHVEELCNATLHVHPTEMGYATGCSMCRPLLRRPYDVEQVCNVVRALYGGRVRFSASPDEVAPGVTLHHVGGHTPGLQVVRVETARGNVVLASDALHFYANMTRDNPYSIYVDLNAYVEGVERLKTLADTFEHIVPGHDPRVKRMYPPVGGSRFICDLTSPPAPLPPDDF